MIHYLLKAVSIMWCISSKKKLLISCTLIGCHFLLICCTLIGCCCWFAVRWLVVVVVVCRHQLLSTVVQCLNDDDPDVRKVTAGSLLLRLLLIIITSVKHLSLLTYMSGRCAQQVFWTSHEARVSHTERDVLQRWTHLLTWGHAKWHITGAGLIQALNTVFCWYWVIVMCVCVCLCVCVWLTDC